LLVSRKVWKVERTQGVEEGVDVFAKREDSSIETGGREREASIPARDKVPLVTAW
jgi:hypothetical protein